MIQQEVAISCTGALRIPVVVTLYECIKFTRTCELQHYSCYVAFTKQSEPGRLILKGTQSRYTCHVDTPSLSEAPTTSYSRWTHQQYSTNAGLVTDKTPRPIRKYSRKVRCNPPRVEDYIVVMHFYGWLNADTLTWYLSPELEGTSKSIFASWRTRTPDNR